VDDPKVDNNQGTPNGPSAGRGDATDDDNDPDAEVCDSKDMPNLNQEFDAASLSRDDKSDDLRGEANDPSSPNPAQEDGHNTPSRSADQFTATKGKGEKMDPTADNDTPVTATTCNETLNETMSQISPQALNTTISTRSDGEGGESAQQDDGHPSAPPFAHMYQTHRKAPPPHHAARSPQSSPHYSQGSRGSFSQITNPPSASAFYNAPPPPPNSAGRGSYMYQYQHYDPRSHVDAPRPPKRNMNDPALVGSGPSNDPYYEEGPVPPTVHMPNAPGAIKDLSPLPNFASAIKSSGAQGDPPHVMHHGHPNVTSKMPATPRHSRESEAAAGIAQLSGEKRNAARSPLDLLSSVSSSPVAPSGRHRERGGDIDGPSYRASLRGGSHNHPSHHAYSYPPGYHPPPPHHRHAHHRAPSEEESPPAHATPAPKSSSLCDLILSAANTLDHEDGKKRKFTSLDDDDDDFDGKHLKKAPAPTNLFSVGGYPPGLDPSTLPPSRSSLKPAPKNLKGKVIDPDTITQAQKASMLAQQALELPRVGKQLLLSMALVRTNPRTPPSCYPSHGTILTDRFHWAAFPPLDTVLRKHMKKYYELSTNKCQSRDQQEFNNELVLKIRVEAKKYGWEFDDKAFDDKKIRDRIRCFFKTHIQNAKKRLKTMLRNPEKRANIKALAAHFHLIEEKGVDEMHHDDHSDVEDDMGYGLSQSYSNEMCDHRHHNDVVHTFRNDHHHNHDLDNGCMEV